MSKPSNTATCPVCQGTSTSEYSTHKRWQVPCLRCNDCGHVFSSVYVNEPEDTFSTNQLRAEFYLAQLKDLHFERVLDVGTPRDFYFLKHIHQAAPAVRLYALDLYEKPHPDYIALKHSFEGIQVDLCTAFHVLEHVEEPIGFVKAITGCSRWYIIEVPECDSQEHIAVSSTAPHMHFFTLSSFRRLFTAIGENPTIYRRWGGDIPGGRSVLVATELPKRMAVAKTDSTRRFSFWSGLWSLIANSGSAYRKSLLKKVWFVIAHPGSSWRAFRSHCIREQDRIEIACPGDESQATVMNL